MSAKQEERIRKAVAELRRALQDRFRDDWSLAVMGRGEKVACCNYHDGIVGWAIPSNEQDPRHE